MGLLIIKKPAFLGFLAGTLLLILYFLILTLANSFSHALSQFNQFWYWILILVIGFSFQVYLYFYIRESQKIVSGKALAASGSISTGSMIVCCLHHLVDVLPIIGLSAIALFLTQYQVLFLVVGIISNLIGIVIMLEIIQKHNLAGENKILDKIVSFPLGKIKKSLLISSPFLILIIFLSMNVWSNKNVSPIAETGGKQEFFGSNINLPVKPDTQAGITFLVTPIDFSFEKEVKFEISVDTHSGSLDFDLTKISFLEDDKGNQYKPITWQGPDPGGHHLSGILIFPKLNRQVKNIKLTIQDASPRVFEWSLK